eukprot:jgi/Botrbrau1/5097/Bobra.0128s0008.1
MAPLEVMGGIENVVGAANGLVEVLRTMRDGARAVQRAGWQRQRLAEQLCGIQDVIEETKAQYQGVSGNVRIPISKAGRVALKNLVLNVLKIEKEVELLQKEIPGLEEEVKKFHEAMPLRPVSRRPMMRLITKIKMACMPPEWVTRLPNVLEQLHQKVHRAKELQVFQFSTTFCESIPRLYIRPTGLYDEVVSHLQQVREGGSVRGVLIWGGKGMGKTCLARDVAHAFAFDPGLSEYFPDGVFNLDCGPAVSERVQQGEPNMTECFQRALLDKLVGRENQDAEIRGTGRQDISNRLGLELKERRCLIWLDNVRDPRVVEACCPEGFAGALLVTSNNDNTCDLLPAGVSLRFVNVAYGMFWKAGEGSGGSFATKILAARAANDANTETFPPGCEEVGRRLVDMCEGSVLALAVIGNHLRGKTTLQAWLSVKESLTIRLQASEQLLLDYPKTVFGVLDLVLDGLRSQDDHKVLLALWQFRPGAVLPFPLVKLAVQVETGRDWEPAELEFSLEKIVKANLLEVCDDDALMGASKGKKGYRLLDLVGMWLTERKRDCIREPLFQEPRDRAGPRPPEQAEEGEESSVGGERQRRCKVLAAFLATFGKVEGSLNVPQKAERFLKEAIGWGFDRWGIRT